MRLLSSPVAAVALLALAASALGACSTRTKAPFDEGVCYYVVPDESGAKGKLRFNRVADHQPQIEHCAARLEEMRLRFLRLGGSNREITGSYQGQFIFIDRYGVSIARTLEGSRFFALARTGDGRLAVPGAIQRDVDGTPAGTVTTP